MEIATAQAELRKAYVHGGPGAVVSGLVWLAAAIVATSAGIPTGFAVLFFGGMLIFPLAALVVRTLFRRAPAASENPYGRTVIETIFPMIGGLLAAWLILPHRPDFVFPLAAIAVGTHYFGFRTAYGDVTYWILGAIMSVIGLAAIFTNLFNTALVPYAIAAVELLFGAWLTWRGVTKESATTLPLAR